MARLGEFDEDAVLEAATQFFWKDGYEATSMRDLADHTGMTTPSLYNPLGNKRGASRIARPSIPRSPPLLEHRNAQSPPPALAQRRRDTRMSCKHSCMVLHLRTNHPRDSLFVADA